MTERVHGGIDLRELAQHGVAPGDVVDFSVNLSPYGRSPALLEAVRTAELEHYPDPQARTAREAWGRALGRDAGELAVGHGAADLFWAVARAFLREGDRVVIAEPTFSELRFAAGAMGARVERVFAPEHDLRLDLAMLAEVARGARMLYLCSPNNPTGEYLPAARVAALARALEDTAVVLDQSFIGLSDHAGEFARGLPDNVICVRSLTKELACPGLRIGLCVAPRAHIARIEQARPTWATSAPALAALARSAELLSFVAAGWARLKADRDALTVALRARGLAPLPSDTSFQLVPLGAPAARLRGALLARGVLVRDAASFGLPRHVRLAALPSAARVRLLTALDAVLAAG